MMHPHTELRYINAAIGFGVFATELIPAGTLTWVYDELDQVIVPERIQPLPVRFRDLLDKYTFRMATGEHVLCWDLARFMNHSCDPNCLGPDSCLEIALRDIPPGEELTDDYANLHLQAHESFDCGCGMAGCRGRITPADARVMRARWQGKLEEAFAKFQAVDQPLAPILGISLRQERIGAPALQFLHDYAMMAPSPATLSKRP